MRRIVTTVTLVGLLTVVAGVVLDRGGYWVWGPARTARGAVLAALVLLLVSGLAALVRNRVLPVLGAAGALVASVVVGLDTVSVVRDGLPAPSSGVLAVGVLVTLAGLLVAAVGAVRRPTRPGVPGRDPGGADPTGTGAPIGGSTGGDGAAGGGDRGSGRATVARLGRTALVAVVVAAAAYGAGSGIGALVDVGETAGTPGPAAEPVVLRPGAPRWRWTSPTRVADVLPTDRGVVVRHAAVDGGDELVALDGATGTPRWTFRRGRSPIDAVTVTPDGRSVVLTHLLRPTGPLSARSSSLITVLDADTGARRWDAVPAFRTGESLDYGVFQLTDRVLTVLEPAPAGRTRPHGDSYRIVARALDTGRIAWTWTPPDECTLSDYGIVASHVRYPLPLRARDVVAGWQDCGNDRIGTGLDDRTGAVRWTHPPMPYRVNGELLDDPVLAGSPAADRLVYRAGSGGDVRVVDAATGRIVARPPGIGGMITPPVRPGPVRALLPHTRTGDDRTDVFASLDPVTGRLEEPPPAGPVSCHTAEGGIAVTASATLRLCGAGPGFGLRVDAPGAAPRVVPIDPGAPVLDPPDRGRYAFYTVPSDYMIIPAPGALVVGVTFTEPSVLVGLGPG